MEVRRGEEKRGKSVGRVQFLVVSPRVRRRACIHRGEDVEGSQYWRRERNEVFDPVALPSGSAPLLSRPSFLLLPRTRQSSIPARSSRDAELPPTLTRPLRHCCSTTHSLPLITSTTSYCGHGSCRGRREACECISGISRGPGARADSVRSLSLPSSYPPSSPPRPPVDCVCCSFADKQSYLASRTAFLQSLPPVLDLVTAPLPPQPCSVSKGQLEEWWKEHDRIEEEVRGFDMGDLERFRGLARGAFAFFSSLLSSSSIPSPKRAGMRIRLTEV